MFVHPMGEAKDGRVQIDDVAFDVLKELVQLRTLIWP